MRCVLPNYVFVIIIAFLTGYNTFLTTKGSLTNNSYSKLWNKLTKRGKSVFFLLIFILIVLVLQECNNQRLNLNKDNLLKNEENTRDSLIVNGIKSGVQSNSDRLFSKLSQAFANQDLKLDTLKNTVGKLKDSVNTSMYNNSQQDPIFSIKFNGVKLISSQNLIYNYELEMTSVDAGSSNYKVKSYMYTVFQNDTYSLMMPNFLDNVKISKDGKWTMTFQINSVSPVKNIYLYFTGKYSTLDGSKSYPLNDIYIYEEITKEIWILMNPDRDEIISKIKNYQKESE